MYSSSYIHNSLPYKRQHCYLISEFSMANLYWCFKTSIPDSTLKFSPTSADRISHSFLFHSCSWHSLVLSIHVVRSMEGRSWQQPVTPFSRIIPLLLIRLLFGVPVLTPQFTSQSLPQALLATVISQCSQVHWFPQISLVCWLHGSWL